VTTGGLALATAAATQHDGLASDSVESLTTLAVSLREQVMASHKRTLTLAMELGEVLIAIKRQLGHGRWGLWLADEFHLSQDSAENFMTLARNSEALGKSTLPEDLTVTAALAQLRSQRQQAGMLARQADVAQAQWAGLPDTAAIWQADAADTGLADGAVHGLIVFSPPYSVGLTYQSVEDCNWQLYAERVRNWCQELWRIAGDQTRVAVNVANDVWDQQEDCPRDLEHLWKARLYAVGFSYRCTIDWIDGNGQRNGHGHHAFGSVDSANAPHVLNPTERVIVVYKGGWNLRRHEEHDLDRETRLAWLLGIWNILGEHRAQHGHPAPFPEELVRRLVLLYTYLGDTVYDPFCGSGTAPYVAHQLGRVAWGSDAWPLAVQLTQQRLAA